MSEYNETIIHTFAEILEKFAFMFADPCGKDELPESDSSYLIASVNFNGAREGRLTLAGVREMAVELASNVLGLMPDEEITDDQCLDSMKELLNVTCGNLLTALAGEDPVFEMKAPEASILSFDDWKKLVEDPDTLAFNVDEMPCMLKLIMNS